jgi:tellurite resistance protein
MKTYQEYITQRPTFLEFLPVSLFGGVMGLSGLCFSWRRAQELWHINGEPSEGIGLLTGLTFLVLTVAYLLKCLKFPELVREEFTGSVTKCFFATFIVCLLLIPGILLPYFREMAIYLWIFGTIFMFFFAWYVLRKWLDNRQPEKMAHPAWMLPVVGTLDVPIVGNYLSIPGSHEICLAFFGIGLVFSIILMTIIISRLIFQAPLPDTVLPTLLILTGPFALAFLCYDGLFHHLDTLSAVLFYFNLFLFLLLVSKIIWIPQSCPFKVSWWSVSFPLTTITVSALTYARYKGDIIHQLLAAILLGVTTLVIGFLFIQTIYRIIKGTFAVRS